MRVGGGVGRDVGRRAAVGVDEDPPARGGAGAARAQVRDEGREGVVGGEGGGGDGGGARGEEGVGEQVVGEAEGGGVGVEPGGVGDGGGGRGDVGHAVVQAQGVEGGARAEEGAAHEERGALEDDESVEVAGQGWVGDEGLPGLEGLGEDGGVGRGDVVLVGHDVGRLRLGVELERGGDAEGLARAAHRPEEVRVGGAGGADDGAVGQDHFD